MVPEAGCSRPATARSSVDFPQPDGPSTATTEPAGTSRSTWSTARVPSKRTVRSSTSSPRSPSLPHHQNAPIDPTRNRWTTSITPVVVAASTTEAAIAIPKFSAPGWPISR